MQKSSIQIDIHLDEKKMPEQINWSASETGSDKVQRAKAMCLGFWDGMEKNTLKIDLWTKDMMVDEMGDFFYQSMMGMADTFDRSTGQHALAHEMKHFAQDFFKKFQENLRQQG